MNREPCIVCGHPTGDCVGEHTGNVRILGAEVFPSLGYNDWFVVEEDVFETRRIIGDEETGLTIQARVLRKGQKIPWSLAVEHGLVSA